MYGCNGYSYRSSVGCPLDDLAEVHDRYLVREVADGREVVRHHQVAHVALRLQVPQQVHDLRLHGHVERRDRLVEHDQRRPHAEGARQRDALPLAAAELVREEIGLFGAQADVVQQLQHALPRLARAHAAG